MKSFLITLICFYVCCAGGSEAKSSVYEEFSQLRDAAYDGDLDYIQQRFKVIKSERTEAEKGQLRSSLIVEDALAGNQIEIVEWCIENDKNLEKLSGLFSTKLVDEKYAAIILRKIPDKRE